MTEFKPVEEPIYGEAYLPLKFKTAFALPEDNCIDIHANDLGFLTIVEDGKIVGYNVLVGGGMGTVPSAEKSFPAVALPLTFVTPDQVLAVAEAVVKVQRDFGNREDRKIARLKYLIHDWGIPRFKAKVEEYFGGPLPEPKPVVVTNVDDHIGWREQGDGKLYLGINIDSGRIKDEGDLRLKTALRTILQKYGMRTRLTPLQSVILCDVDPKDQADIDQILTSHGVLSAEQISPLRRYAMACPAMPTCGLSVAESERVLLELIAALEAEMAKYGLESDRLAVHMTGCPNGCARPYTPDIGIVGKTLGKYTVFLGGNVQGTRLAFIYDDVVPFDEIPGRLSPVFALYKSEREGGESFGDFCHRIGQERIAKFAEEFASAS